MLYYLSMVSSNISKSFHVDIDKELLSKWKRTISRDEKIRDRFEKLIREDIKKHDKL